MISTRILLLSVIVFLVHLCGSFAAKPIELQFRLSGSTTAVVPLVQREKVISFLDDILSNQSLPDYNGFEGVIDPFYPEQEEEPEVVVVRAPIKPVIEEPEIDPREVLRAAGELMKGQIRGTLSRGSRKFLTTADGTFFGVGSEIPFTFENEDFVLTVEEVADRYFTLRLDSTRRRVSILDAAR